MKDIKLWLQAKLKFTGVPIDEVAELTNEWASRTGATQEQKQSYLQGLQKGLSYYNSGEVPVVVEQSFAYPAKDSSAKTKAKTKYAAVKKVTKKVKTGDEALWE